jgi:hypothetical protein
MLVKIPWMEVVVLTSEIKIVDLFYDHNKSVVEVYVVIYLECAKLGGRTDLQNH